MDESGLIDTYLDDLFAALRGEPRRARRILIEAEDHLREAVRDHIAAGMSESDAERLAIERFGSAREIAERFGAGDVVDGAPCSSSSRCSCDPACTHCVR